MIYYASAFEKRPFFLATTPQAAMAPTTAAEATTVAVMSEPVCLITLVVETTVFALPVSVFLTTPVTVPSALTLTSIPTAASSSVTT